MTFSDPGFWVALLQIIGINIVLSGDNAVVIALAARSLPPKQQKQAVLWGSGAAVVMRIILTVVAVQLLSLPYLKLIGAALLLWIGVQLLLPEDEGEGHGKEGGNTGMVAAIRTILIADLVMSLDNVIVAAAAKGSLPLLIIGLVISIPLVIFGSTLLMKFMERWPIIITIGGALLGWVAGEMAVTDPAVKEWIEANAAWLHSFYVAPIVGAAVVVAIGKWLSRRKAERDVSGPVVDLAGPEDQHLPTPAAPESRTRVLLAADDSPKSQRGIDRFLEQMRGLASPVAVDLLNVQSPVPGVVSTFVEGEAIKDLHHDEGMKSLESARARLEQAGIPTVVHIGVGDFTHVVIHYANALDAKQIYVTETERMDGDDLEESVGHMSQHVGLPVTIVR